MAQVPESLLSWLYSRLHEYHDPQRTYADAVRTLSAYPSLRDPATELYTYESGTEALLLNVTGTLPAAFRGTTYHFPIKIWLPQAYPKEPPMVFINPGMDMLIKPGQHVGVDGKVYHPYLRDWAGMWDRASVAEFLEYLQQVFGKEPPVISKAQQQQYQRPLGTLQQPRPGVSPAPPQLPPKQRMGSTNPTQVPSSVGTPPPLPPKPGEEVTESARNVARDGPPLPPLPRELAPGQPRSVSTSFQNGHWQAQSDPPHGAVYPAQTSQNGRPPGGPPQLTPLPQRQSGLPQPQQMRSGHDRSPVSPISPASGYSELPERKFSQAVPPPQPQFQQRMQQPPQVARHSPQYGPYQPQAPQPQPPQPLQASQFLPQQQIPIWPRQQRPPPLDLLSDPFDVALPQRTGPSLPAPPIPPNPEKENLLQAVSGTLTQQAQQKVNHNLSAIAPLQAQQQALRAAHERLAGEIRQLEQLEQVLATNEAILRQSIQDCDRTITTAKSQKQPPIDDVLIAPTVVANQLWTLCAEEAACRESMYVLQKAADRGRVSGNDFVRQMRGLGRECFLKMALARKCARGMGLDS